MANDAAKGQIFDLWKGATFTNPTSPSTTLVMPAAPITVVASYRPILHGEVSFAASAYSRNEDKGAEIITVNRTGGGEGSISVRYQTNDGTARNGSDYTGVSGTLSWDDGDSTPKTFLVTPINDAIAEPDETILLTLLNPTGGVTVGSVNSAVLTIRDDETVDLMVMSGAGSGGYRVGTSVSITANAAPAKVFDTWTGAAVADPTSPTTTIIMPPENVMVTATYKNSSSVPSYVVTVTKEIGGGRPLCGGAGGFNLRQNSAAAGTVFDHWQADVVLNNDRAPRTTFLMPARAVSATAIFRSMTGAPSVGVGETEGFTKFPNVTTGPMSIKFESSKQQMAELAEQTKDI